MTTAAQIIAEALHLFGIVDQTEQPTATDIANNVTILNDLGKVIDTNVDIVPLQYSEHVIQLSFKPLR